MTKSDKLYAKQHETYIKLLTIQIKGLKQDVNILKKEHQTKKVLLMINKEALKQSQKEFNEWKKKLTPKKAGKK